ncbi:hypothetical protein FTUN_3036 [Frigoriglobus tundricola]|uniref:Pyrrolo-quinoline quinone repeat domain-containing protein n=2 Tax=Frigoriglobus tundricola TaxID=2774151 RepID=A0A6M5YN60_9BACT|nr:hypothetical protein FTUN_3036 [Frigoriglobus tundricola]
MLDEELDALPEKVRGPAVLCWLDGLTQDAAAARLGTSRNTLKRRLEVARELLRARLTRRGLAPLLAATVVLAPDGLRAEVPVALRAATTDAALSANALRSGWAHLFALSAVLAAVACGFAFVSGGGTPPEAPQPRVALPTEPLPVAADAPLPPGAVARFGSMQFRTEEWIGTAAQSPDGKRIAIAYGSSVRVYEAATWRLLQRFSAEGNGGGPEHRPTLAFSRHGDRLAYVKNGRYAYSWDLKTEKQLHQIDHADRSWQGYCAFAPDGLLALVDKEKLRFFDPATGTEKRSVGAANVIALSPDGKYFVRYASLHGRVEPVTLGDTATGKDLHTFETGVWQWSTVSFTPDGKRLALVTKEGNLVEMWDTDKRARVRCFNAPTMKRPERPSQYSAGLTPDGSEVWLQLPNGDLARWDAETSRELPRLVTGTAPAPEGLFPLPDGRTLLAPCGNWVRVFDRESGKERAVPGRYQLSAVFAVSPDGQVVAAGDPSGRIDLLDSITGKVVRTLRERGGRVLTLAFGPTSAVLGVGDVTMADDPTRHRSGVRAFRVPDGKELWSRSSADEKEPFVGLLGFASDDRALLHPNFWDQVRAWDAKIGKDIYRIDICCRNAAIGPSGKLLASDDSGEVVLSDLGTGRSVKRIEVDPEERERKRRPGGFKRFAWSADGRTLVTTLPEDVVCVLDPVTGTERTQFAVYRGKVTNSFKSDFWRDGGHTIYTLALSPDGKRLLASALDGAYVALWDTRTGQQLAKLEPGFTINSAAFSTDGKSVFTFGDTGLGYRWDVETLIAAQSPKK